MRMNIKSIKIKLFYYLLHKDSFIFKQSDSMAKINTILGKRECEIILNGTILKSKTIIDKINARIELGTIMTINKSNNFSNFEGLKQTNLSFIVGI